MRFIDSDIKRDIEREFGNILGFFLSSFIVSLIIIFWSYPAIYLWHIGFIKNALFYLGAFPSVFFITLVYVSTKQNCIKRARQLVTEGE